MIETAYLAHPDYVEELAAELGDVRERYDQLLIAPGPARPAVWAQNIWHEPTRLAISSIGDAAKSLVAIQRSWAHYPFEAQSRGRLISEKLPHVSSKRLVFPQPGPDAPLGSWTLLDRDTLLYAAHCSSAFRNGEVHFVEDRVNPPTRAYLKLWEALTLSDQRPQPGDLCLDLGSSPGGWTWVLQQLGARVISVDKARLDPRIDSLPNVEFRDQSAFALEPKEFDHVDWIFSDIACYPKRLLTMVRRWMESGVCENFICTIKLQDDRDQVFLQDFNAIAGSTIRHLWHNKHELTWTRCAPSEIATQATPAT